MRCPTVSGPRDVPQLREWMLQEWWPPNAFALSAKLQIFGHDGSDEEVVTAVRWNLQELVLSELWWIDAAMSELVSESSKDLPPVTLRPELVPASPVLTVFEKTLYGSDAEGSELPVAVDAFMWGWTQLRDAGPSLALSMYQRASLDDGLSREAMRSGAHVVLEVAGQEVHRARPTKGGLGVDLHGELWIPIGRTHWVVGADWDDVIVDKGVSASPTAHRSMVEDRKWLATLWALALEPKIAESRVDTGHRGDRRRAERAGKQLPTVKVVSLRRSVQRAAQKAAEGGRGQLTHRHIVRGHWRQQPYGPGRRWRRPQFIATHVKGPEGAPLQPGATVKVLREEDE